MRHASSAALSLAVLVLVGWLCVSNAAEVSAAITAIPWWGFAAAVGLHIVTLVLRSEAWRLTLASVEGTILPRSVVHGANAAAFIAGAAQSQAALPARVAVLRRMAADRAPRPAQIYMADVPIFALELCATSALLMAAALAGYVAAWVAVVAPVLALAVLVAARVLPARYPHRPMVRGLAILADRRRRRSLVGLVAALSAVTAVRIWLILLVCGLPHGFGEVAWLLAALGAFGLLPFGPGAPPGATVATLGVGVGAGVGTAVAGGLVIGASGIAAVLVYMLAVGAVAAGQRARPRRRGAAGERRVHARGRSGRRERAALRAAAVSRPAG